MSVAAPKSNEKVRRSKREQAEIYQCAEMMVRMNARACVITKLTGLPSLEVRDLWQKVAGRSSPSGQQPSDLQWYLKTAARRYHAALIIQLYAKALQSLKPFAALTHAYYHYARMTSATVPRSVWFERGDPAFRGDERDYEISFARAHYLCQIYTDETMADGKTRKCHLVIKRCKRCNGLYLSTRDEASRYCPLCEK